MLDSGGRAFFDIIDVFLLGVATFLSNLVKIGQKFRERYQFFRIQDGCVRHFEEYTAGCTTILRVEF